jgi:hypothetical protein
MRSIALKIEREQGIDLVECFTFRIAFPELIVVGAVVEQELRLRVAAVTVNDDFDRVASAR